MGKWYEEAIFYHIYPLGLTGAPRENRGEGVEHRLRDLTAWLDHLENMGFTAIYIGPLFESSAHGYDTRDYRMVDRRLGDKEDFKNFVAKAHKKNMKVIVDGVFNHTGREFFAFEDIKKNRENSPYVGWYKGIWFDGNSAWNDGFSYESWRGCGDLVNLNLGNPQVREYLLEDVIHYWIDEFAIDGIRLDCADCLDFYFMEEMRRRTESWKEDFWLMGEVIHGDYARYIREGAPKLHSVTNYELHKGLYSGHNDHNYFEIAHTIRRQFDANGGIYQGLRLYSFVDNHDVDRLSSKLNVWENSFPIYGLLYFLPGIPSVYYGSEFGIEGRKNGPDDSPMRPHLELEQIKKENPHPDLTEWIKTLAKIRSQHPAGIYGRYQELMLTNRQYAFARIADNDAVIIAVNNDESPADVRFGAPVQGQWMNALTGETCDLADGQISVHIKENGCVILCMAGEV